LVKLIAYIKNRNWLRYILFLIVLIYGAKYILNNADNIPAAKSWLAQQPEIISRVGNNIEVDVKRITWSQSSYDRYLLKIKGDLGSAKVVVNYIHDQSKFEIDSIK
jgi:hypothetical protein